MTANLMNLHIAKGPKVTADKLLGRQKTGKHWEARGTAMSPAAASGADMFFRAMEIDGKK